jgi:lysophospholipase L1-like esterase
MEFDAAVGAAYKLKPLAEWSRRYQGLQPLPGVMSSPPTITVGASNGASAITGIANSANVPPTDARLTYVGPSNYDGNYVGQSAGFIGNRVRFSYSGRRFEMRLQSFFGEGVSIYVDGQLVSKDGPPNGGPWWAMSQGGNHLVLVDFGANTYDSYAAAVTSITAGGTGYAAGDEITLAGGTSSTPVVLRVLAVSSGAITAATVKTPGTYTATPASPVAQASTTGAGTGATFNIAWARNNPTQKSRLIEIVLDRGVQLGGLNIETSTSLIPYPAGGAKLAFSGDSFIAGLNGDYAAGNWTEQAAALLGLRDNFERQGVGGRGWVASPITNADLDALAARAPDGVVVALGINDDLTSQNTATLQSTVTTKLNYLLAALPTAPIVVLTGYTNVNGRGAYVKAGALAASDQNRIRVIDLTASNIYGAGTTNTPFVSSDSVHPSQQGMDYLAKSLAPLIGAALRDMVGVLGGAA